MVRMQVAALGLMAGLMGMLAPAAGAQAVRASLDRLQEAPRPDAAAAPSSAAPDEDAALRARYVSPELLESEVDAEVYVLGPGDLLGLVLVVGETRAFQVPVLPEGVVVVPHVGPVPAAGRTLAAFRTALQAAVARRYRDFDLTCHLVRARAFRVYVTGEVKAPGMLAARASERVSDVIERAGGLTDRASRREVELRDGAGALVAQVDLARFLVRGRLDDNPTLGPGQVVRVPPRGRTTLLLGEVRAAGAFEVRPGEPLGELLELAGGPTSVADLEHVTVEWTEPSGAIRVEIVDLRDGGPPADGASRVTVLSTLLGRPRGFFIGPDDRQQTLYLSPGETLADLVRRTATLSPDADLGAAQLATHDAAGRPVQVPVDLRRVLAGEQNRPLHDGDVLSVPGVKGYVYVSGYVSKPGRYAYRADWSVSDYVGEAGGATDGGSRDRTRLLGPDGGWRQADHRTPVQRGETVFVGRSRGGQAGTVLGVLTNVSALVISVVALTR